MAISKKWKIVIVVALIVIVGGIALVVGGGYFGWQWMMKNAQEVYGGPIPSDVMPVMGFPVDTHKMAMYMDLKSNMAMVVIQSPPVEGGEKKPFSEKDIDSALARFGGEQQIEQSFEGASQGQPSTIQLGDQTVHTLRFTNNEGQHNEMGVLNLDKNQMLFIAVWDSPDQVNSESLSQFLMEMPVIKNDSHMQASASIRSEELALPSR